ncbi:MAG: PTS lactose/cellobiose transporter subunit IIA [Cetobacterium sp.]|uniref:PTS lactose/cellobiose transporter subunit IIA n=1 Tax=unclassified Cetobacterium TaxID=2630983 RepID=UPI00211679F9|nr:PTS lactose/cellobiose transporter subunit IIA [Cetobacterium sp. NK01]MCQ8212008.1 PTS lactose/cellobiose transporter subunit IIA [Cetobacterium sp. NK01]
MVDFTEEELEEIIFSIVAYAGEAKGCAHQALAFAEEGKFEEAEECMKECDAAVLKAHHVQTDMIQKEAGGQKIPLSIVFVHAQDHLMTALSERELIKKMIKLNKRLFALENK